MPDTPPDLSRGKGTTENSDLQEKSIKFQINGKEPRTADEAADFSAEETEDMTKKDQIFLYENFDNSGKSINFAEINLWIMTKEQEAIIPYEAHWEVQQRGAEYIAQSKPQMSAEMSAQFSMLRNSNIWKAEE